MLPVYKKKMNIGGIVFAASVLAIVFLILVAPKFWIDNPLVNALLKLTAVGSYWYICWATTKGKGYAGWIGIISAIFGILGIAILIFLIDRHKGES